MFMSKVSGIYICFLKLLTDDQQGPLNNQSVAQGALFYLLGIYAFRRFSEYRTHFLTSAHAYHHLKLQQPLCHPMSLADQVITLVTANNRLLLDVETKQTKDFQLRLLDFFHAEHKDIVDELNNNKVLNEELTEKIVAAVKEFKSR